MKEENQVENRARKSAGYYVVMVVAYIFFASAAVDCFLANVLGCDLTGVRWSPIAFGIVGCGFQKIASKIKG